MLTTNTILEQIGLHLIPQPPLTTCASWIAFKKLPLAQQQETMQIMAAFNEVGALTLDQMLYISDYAGRGATVLAAAIRRAKVEAPGTIDHEHKEGGGEIDGTTDNGNPQ